MNRIFAVFDIKRGERTGVWLLFLFTLMLSVSASIGRSIGMTLLVGHADERILPTSFIAIDVLVMAGSVLYAAFTQRVSANIILRRLLFLFTTFNAVFAIRFLWPGTSYQLYFIVFSALYILLSIHLTSFIASYYSSIQLRRLLILILSGVSLGASLGGGVVILCSTHLAPESLQWFVLIPCFLAGWILHRLEHNITPILQQPSTQRPNFRQDLHRTLTFIRRSSLIFYLTLSFVFFVLVGRLLEFEYHGLIYPQLFPDLQARAHFYGQYELIANIAALLTQLFLSRWLLRKMGVAASNIVYPGLTLLAALGLLLHPGLVFGVVAHFVNQELRQTIRSPACSLLFNAVPYRFWGGCKAYLHGFVFPLSTIAASLLLIVAQQHIAPSNLLQVLTLCVLLFSCIGVIITLSLGAAYRYGVFQRLDPDQGAHQQETLPPERMIASLLDAQSRKHRLTALQMIRTLHTDGLLHQVGKLLVRSHSTEEQSACAKTLAAFPEHDISLTYLMKALRFERKVDSITSILDHLRAFPNADLSQRIQPFLLHPNPQVFAATISCATVNRGFADKAQLETRLFQRLHAACPAQQRVLLNALLYVTSTAAQQQLSVFAIQADAGLRATAIDILLQVDESRSDALYPDLIDLLSQPDATAQLIGLKHLQNVSHIHHWPQILSYLNANDTRVQHAAFELIRYHIPTVRDALLALLLRTQEESYAQRLFNILFTQLNRQEKQRLWRTADDRLRQYAEALLAFHQNATDTRVELAAQMKNALGYFLLTLLHHLQTDVRDYPQLLASLLSSQKAEIGNALEALSQLPKHPQKKRLMDIFENYVLQQQYHQAYQAVTDHRYTGTK